MTGPLAHSAATPSDEPQSYADHVAGVAAGATARAAAMLRYLTDEERKDALAQAVAAAAGYHDLGKLDPEIQTALRQGRRAKLAWDHIDAGVAFLKRRKAHWAAWLVRAHHAPGLPSKPAHFVGAAARKLRGRRHDVDPEVQDAQIERTDGRLDDMVALHEAVLGQSPAPPGASVHGLPMRLALSCLVDADHSNTAESDTGWREPQPARPRWSERLAALDRYVAGLAASGGARNDLRQAFYAACRARSPDAAMMACEGPVGIGKTTAVLAYLLRRAEAAHARRLFVVAPFTAILTQTADVLRKALLLEDERDDPDRVIAEHHHRAEFGSLASRDLATLWSAPIILTTAVQFFETLSSNNPVALRKLHMMPGSVVFFDEAHAMLPVSALRHSADRASSKELLTAVMPQYWRWLVELADRWTCSFVFASGSLARFWRIADIAGEHCRDLPDLVPRALAEPLRVAEGARVRYSARRFADIASFLATVDAEPGPRLAIMNTVQSAAVVAQAAREAGHDVLHLSTALCPRDRDAILAKARTRLKGSCDTRWTLVATSLVEAGVDISFRVAFRERFATTSLIQVGGRVNRNAELDDGGDVVDFTIERGEGLTRHPEARIPADVLADLFENDRLRGDIDPAAIVTEALIRQMAQKRRPPDLLGEAERQGDYPEVASLARLIEADTRFVVVDPGLRARLEKRAHVTMRDLLGGSVQLWARRIDQLALDPISGRPDLYWWPHAYDPDFLGYMAGALKLAGVARGEAVIL